MRRVIATTALIMRLASASAAEVTTVRTEVYARPPYSGATYFIYERGGSTICTKLAVCNKFNDCDNKYARGPFKDPEDVQSGAPADTTPKVAIKDASLSKHVCLTQFGLVGQR